MKISNIVSGLTATYLDWKDLLVNPNFVRKGSEIAWQGEHGFMSSFMSEDDFRQLAGQRAFSFQVDDGSLLQLYYRFDEKSSQLSQASLAFIWYPGDEILAKYRTVPWLRFDYDVATAGGPTHTASHMHLAYVSQLRLPVSRIPSPAQFVELIACWFYPKHYRDHRSNSKQTWPPTSVLSEVNSDASDDDDVDALASVAHIAVPPRPG